MVPKGYNKTGASVEQCKMIAHNRNKTYTERLSVVFDASTKEPFVGFYDTFPEKTDIVCPEGPGSGICWICEVKCCPNN
jgi:hypothetical protein